MKISRKYLSAQGRLSIIRLQFNKIKPPREPAPRSNPIKLTDCLMSGLAVFSLSDEVDPKEIRKAYKTVLSCVQRGKALEEFAYLDNHYLLPEDGTGSLRELLC